MKYRIVILGVAICILFLGGIVAADQLTIVTGGWVTAGSSETAGIVITATNNMSNPIKDATLIVYVTDTAMGRVTMNAAQTNTQGQIYGTFEPGTKSGDAIIYAEIAGTTVNTTAIQRVDHATPRKWSLVKYPPSSPVSTNGTITVRMNDQFNNTVDSLREDDELRDAEIIFFRDSEDGDGGFWFGSAYVHALAVEVDADGNATVDYRIPSIAGNNVIQITAPKTVSSYIQWIVLRGIAVTPASITSQLYPIDGIATANNRDAFSLTYTVRDVYGNAVPNAPFWRNTSLGERDRFVTNDQGVAVTVYGPKNSVGIVNITAEVESDPINISVQNTVEFIPTDPVMWELTASPQILASHEVNSGSSAEIKVKVIDALGNPVDGVIITFAIMNNSNPLLSPSTLDEESSLTDDDGFAMVKFRPGTFPSEGEAGYNDNSISLVTVQATWVDGSGTVREKDITLTVKNYPYLRIETEVDPQTMGVNETINVTVRLIGDGWAMQTKPIDAVLVFDRSGSMGQDDPTRISQAKSAAVTFVDQMDSSRDQVGLVSFSSSTSLDQSLTSQMSTVKTRINSLNADGATQLRMATYTGITNAKNYGRAGAVKAVILMTDGEWNYDGNPLGVGNGFTGTRATWPGNVPNFDSYQYYDALGGGTYINSQIQVPDGSHCIHYTGSTCDQYEPEYITRTTYHYEDADESNQNMSVYARNNGVRIYAITFAYQPVDGCTDALTTMADSTGGFYAHAPDGEALTEIYRKIAGDLKSVAGVNTQMNLSFETLDVTYDNMTRSVSGIDVFDYIYEEDVSTVVSSWNFTPSGVRNDLYSYNRDDTDNWTAQRLDFDAGNITINQTWQAKFKLITKIPGSIDIFGPESRVIFGDGGEVYTLSLPKTFISSIANLTPQTENQALVDVKDLEVINYTGPESVTDRLYIQWFLNYTGYQKVRLDAYYQFSRDNITWSNSWTHLGTEITGSGNITDKAYNSSADVREKTGYYLFRVEAREMIPIGYKSDIIETIQPVYVKMRGSILIT
jgi:hypothetical protein